MTRLDAFGLLWPLGDPHVRADLGAARAVNVGETTTHFAREIPQADHSGTGEVARLRTHGGHSMITLPENRQDRPGTARIARRILARTRAIIPQRNATPSAAPPANSCALPARYQLRCGRNLRHTLPGAEKMSRTAKTFHQILARYKYNPIRYLEAASNPRQPESN
jgi:hypothetical protein